MLQVFNLTNPQQVFQELESPLKYQTRCIACFPDSTGYLLGSIEGRVAVQHVEDSQQVLLLRVCPSIQSISLQLL